MNGPEQDLIYKLFALTVALVVAGAVTVAIGGPVGLLELLDRLLLQKS